MYSDERAVEEWRSDQPKAAKRRARCHLLGCTVEQLLESPSSSVHRANFGAQTSFATWSSGTASNLAKCPDLEALRTDAARTIRRRTACPTFSLHLEEGIRPRL